MKKFYFLLALLLTIILSISACSTGDVSAENLSAEIETLNDEITQLTSTIELLQKENKEQKDTNVQLTRELENLASEYKQYKEKMNEYEELAADELEIRKLEAEKAKEEAAAKKAEEEEAKRIAEEEAAAKKAEEEAKGYETGITYQQIARTPDEFLGKKVTFKGTVVQLIEGDEINQLRFAVDDDYDQMLFLEYDPKILDERVLEYDTITIYGISAGTITYESTLGGNITIPGVMVDKLEIHH